MYTDHGAAATVRLQYRQRPFNGGRNYHDRKTRHTLSYTDGRWTCHTCQFTIRENRYLTWRGIVEDHRNQLGIK